MLRVIVFALVFLLSTSNTWAFKFKFAAFGDSPYILPAGGVMFQQMTKHVNASSAVFSVHVGDIKGGGICNRDYFNYTIDLFNQFKRPVIYTPGDNDWTDCHHLKNGARDPMVVLEILREMFFSTAESFGLNKFVLSRQSELAAFSKYKENQAWQINDIHFATVHVVGSNNNLNSNIPGSQKEFRDRNQANIAWIQKIFKAAKAKQAKAVVLFSHAAMHFGDYYQRKGAGVLEVKGFDSYIAALESEVVNFNLPVLNIVGDSHSFKIDQPLRVGDGYRIPLKNYLRFIVFGFPEVRSSLISIDTDGDDVFSMFSIKAQKAVPWEY